MFGCYSAIGGMKGLEAGWLILEKWLPYTVTLLNRINSLYSNLPHTVRERPAGAVCSSVYLRTMKYILTI